jgi:hypothetical protein
MFLESTKKTSRIIGSCLLVFYLAGCSAIKPGIMPSEAGGGVVESSAVEIKEGSYVWIALHDGQNVHGTVNGLGDTEIRIECWQDRELTIRTIPVDSIASIQVRKHNTLDTMLAVIGGAALLFIWAVSQIDFDAS